jgi:uncharacterized delta-60 repeat protein
MPDAGELDVVFNSTGMAAISLGAGDDQVHAMVVQPDSKVVTVGQSGDGSSEFTVARYDKDGLLDTGFGSGGVVLTGLGPDNDGVAEAVALQPNGQIIVAGYAGTVGSQIIALARYNPDGSLDTSFGNGGTVVTPFEASAMARAAAVAPDGTIIVAGSVQPSAAFTTTDFMVARYNANGSLDTAFGSGGLVDTSLGDFDAAANALVVEPDGTIVAAGHTSTSSGFFNFALVRYNAAAQMEMKEPRTLAEQQERVRQGQMAYLEERMEMSKSPGWRERFSKASNVTLMQYRQAEAARLEAAGLSWNGYRLNKRDGGGTACALKKKSQQGLR